MPDFDTVIYISLKRHTCNTNILSKCIFCSFDDMYTLVCGQVSKFRILNITSQEMIRNIKF